MGYCHLYIVIIKLISKMGFIKVHNRTKCFKSKTKIDNDWSGWIAGVQNVRPSHHRPEFNLWLDVGNKIVLSLFCFKSLLELSLRFNKGSEGLNLTIKLFHSTVVTKTGYKIRCKIWYLSKKKTSDQFTDMLNVFVRFRLHMLKENIIQLQLHSLQNLLM